MHEMGLFRDLMEKLSQIAEEHPGKRIQKISLSLGALSHLSADHFRYHFDALCKGTAAEGAALDITVDSDKNASHAQGILLQSVDVES